MKKRIFALTGILLALLLVLAGCGSRAANDSPGVAGYGSYNQKSESYKASETLFDTENPMPSPGEPATGENSGAALTTDRKLIQTAWMELESRDYAQALAALEGREVPPLPPLADRCDTAVRQIRWAAEDKGEHIAILEARKQYAWYLKGVPHANYYKEQIVRMNTLEDVDRITEGIKRDLK